MACARQSSSKLLRRACLLGSRLSAPAEALASQPAALLPESQPSRPPSSFARAGLFPSQISALRAPASFQAVRGIAVEALKASDTFPRRHNSITPDEAQAMAEFCGFRSMDALIEATVPSAIERPPMELGEVPGGVPGERDAG